MIEKPRIRLVQQGEVWSAEARREEIKVTSRTSGDAVVVAARAAMVRRRQKARDWMQEG